MQASAGRDLAIRDRRSASIRSPRRFVAGIAARSIVLPDVEQFEALPGFGIKAVVEGHTILAGMRKLMASYAVELPAQAEKNEGRSEQYIGCDCDDPQNDGQQSLVDRKGTIG
ncbi:hypothetical protein [Paenibacillus sp. GCM10027626]|uniref:hypothetical protein n=1 Tax=Paenibacillus sp. GCM10027626 TaxID=3273411 RepID=UPI003637A8B3